MRSHSLFLFLFFLPLFFACQETKNIQTDVSIDSSSAQPLVATWNPDTASINAQIRRLFATHKVGDTLAYGSERFTLDTAMVRLYSQRNYQSCWFSLEKFQKLTAVLRSVEFDGLLPEDYHFTSLRAALAKMKDVAISDSSFALAELLASHAFVEYSADMWWGKAEPHQIFWDWNYEQRPADRFVTEAMQVLAQGDLDTLAETLRPKYELYKKLHHTFIAVDSLERLGLGWPDLRYAGKDLLVGDTSTLIYDAKLRLQQMGIYQGKLDTLFDQAFAEDLKHFQHVTYLVETGKLDKVTVEKLNFDLKEVRKTLRVNMERCRWLLHNLPPYYIVVNVASYRLAIIEQGKEIYNTKVIVGKEQTRTPVFETTMNQVIFNPDWTLPRSIIEKETLAALQKNPNYLKTHNMILLRGNTVVDATKIDFSKYTIRTFPFTVRQLPGPDNALGQVKFILLNKYSIYLHDTPSRSLFDRNERSFSHGCVRVHKPIALAKFLLEREGYTSEKIDQMLATGKLTPVTLRKKIPALITYWTCFPDPTTGDLRFFPDIYGRDAEIIAALNAPKKL